MNRIEPDLRDIYQTDQPPQEPVPQPNLHKQIEQKLRRQRILTASIGLAAFLLAVGLSMVVVKDYLAAGQSVAVPVRSLYFEAYSLPEEEQWALEYRQVAFQAERGEPSGPKPLSTKWIKNTAYHIIMGEQALRLDHPGAARLHLETAVETFPGLSGISRLLGAAYLKQFDFEKAVAQLRMALQERASADVLNNLGAALIGTGEYEDAERMLRRALEVHPDLAGGYRNLTLLYQKSGRIEEAVAEFETGLSLEPQDTEMLENFIAWLIAENRTSAAASLLERSDVPGSADSFLLLAGAFSHEGNAEEAVRALRKAARFMTSRRMIVEMRSPAFSKIARTGPFEEFLHRMELAAVSLSSARAEEKGFTEEKTGR